MSSYHRPDIPIPIDATYQEYSKVVDYEVEVPLDYWKSGAQFIPPDAADRVRQLKDYLDLFHGDYSKYLTTLVQNNYHKQTAVFLSLIHI